MLLISRIISTEFAPCLYVQEASAEVFYFPGDFHLITRIDIHPVDQRIGQLSGQTTDPNYLSRQFCPGALFFFIHLGFLKKSLCGAAFISVERILIWSMPESFSLSIRLMGVVAAE